MMKTGIITDEVSQELSVAIDMAKSFGLNALEIRSVEGKNPFQMSLTDYKRIRTQADEAGLEICAIGSPFFKCDMHDSVEIARHMEGLKHVVEAAHILGTKLIRGFSFWKSDDITYQAIAQHYQPVIDLIESEDMTIVLESEPSVNTGNMAQLAELLKVIDNPRVQALYDPGNEICDHAAPPPYPNGYEILKPFIRHIHIKDMVRTSDGYDPVCIGDGEVNFASLFSALRTDGYDGYATLETHWRIAERMDEATMTRPQGYGFSAGGELASRKCLTVLRNKYGFGGFPT